MEQTVSSWFKRNWVSVALILIVLLALVIRAAFAIGPATTNTQSPDEFLVSGGSDSYYHKRVIDHILDTHHQLREDPLLNYPIGRGGYENPRPPLYQWAIVGMGYMISPFTGGDLNIATWYSFIFSTAIWGALTVIPTYGIGKEMFGKKAGLVGAMLLAIGAGNVERSVLTNCDHDAFALFFVVTIFYFFLRSLRLVRGEGWVEDWKNPKSIGKGFKRFFSQNTTSVLYATLSGIALAALMLTWTGYTYVTIILLIYFIFQIFINRFRNVDSLSVTMLLGIMVLVGFVLGSPWYFATGRVAVYLDMPFYLFMLAVGLGLFFSMTRDLPWTLVIPSFVGIAVLGLVAIFFASPELWETIVTGQGYLVKSKLYSTIAEAQPPQFSRVVLAYGAATFFLAIVGVGWAIVTFPKHMKSDYLLTVAWATATIYMAMSAGRFVFNASPSFAIMAGWTIWLGVEWILLKEAKERKPLKWTWAAIRNRSSEVTTGVAAILIALTGAGVILRFFGVWNVLTIVWTAVGILFITFIAILLMFGHKRGISVRQIAFVLFIGFLVVLPNTWYAVDAAMPYETKKGYDLGVYESMPSYMQPDDYDEINGTNWYFGAFGYSLPVNTGQWFEAAYWPDAWEYIASRDNELPERDRPAFVSWWDYGFEAVQLGKHPTVADNFQNGFQWAGNFIMAQGENESVSMFIVRTLEAENKEYDEFRPKVNDVLVRHIGEDDTRLLLDVMQNPEDYTQDVLDDPDTFDLYQDDLSIINTRYAYTKGYLTEKYDLEQLVELYRDLRAVTGVNIRYFAIDSRLIPFSGQNTGIFYAPAKLSDHRIIEDQPSDYYEIIIATDQGEFRAGEVPENAQVEEYKLEYKDRFYDSMLYHCYFGYNGADVGLSQGLPGVSDELQGQPAMPAWNMKHYRLVYRTNYWNPFRDAENHTTKWEAVSLADASERASQEWGSIMPESAGLFHGVTFIEYYDGAFLNGTVTTPEGRPISGVHVTLYDDYGIPHDNGPTDENGEYHLLAPFGNVTMALTRGGTFNQMVQAYSTTLNTTNVTVRDDQAMRERVDMDKDGRWDYEINMDFVLQGVDLTGTVFTDTDGDGTYSDVDESLGGAKVSVVNDTDGVSYSIHTEDDGGYKLTGLPQGTYDLEVKKDGKVIFEESLEMTSTRVKDIAIRSASVRLNLTRLGTEDVAGYNVVLRDEASGETTTETSDAGGLIFFDDLLPGEYTIESGEADEVFDPVTVTLAENDTYSSTILSFLSTDIIGTVTLPGGQPARNLTLQVSVPGEYYEARILTDADGKFAVTVPSGLFQLKARYFVGPDLYIYDGILEAVGPSEFTLVLEEAHRLTGVVTSSDNSASSVVVTLNNDAGVTYRSVSNSKGQYYVLAPTGTYYVTAMSIGQDEGELATFKMVLAGDTQKDISLKTGYPLSGKVFYDSDGDLVSSPEERLPGTMLTFDDGASKIVAFSNVTSEYSLVLRPGRTYTYTLVRSGYVDTVGTYTLPGEDSARKDLLMTPENISVSGFTSLDGQPVDDTVHVFFDSIGSGALSTADEAVQGMFDLELRPGKYHVKVDEVLGNGTSKYTYKDVIEVGVGSPEMVLDLPMQLEYEVKGTFEPAANETTITFYGEEDHEVTATDGSYSTYLPEGTYTMMAKTDANLVTLQEYEITGPAELNHTLVDGVSSDVTVSGGPESGIPVVLEDKATGATLELLHPQETGDLYLPDGAEFTVSVNYTAKDPKTGKYQRYTYDSSKYDAGKALKINLRGEDLLAEVTGRTFAGSVASSVASITFTAMDETATDAESHSDADGTYQVFLAPGNYSVYLTRTGTKYAHLGTLEVPVSSATGQAPLSHDLVMEKSLRVTGRVFYVNTTGQITYTNEEVVFEGDGQVKVAPENDGSYSLLLPEGSYHVTCSVSTQEFGQEMKYAFDTTFNVFEQKMFDVQLIKEKSYRAGVTFEAAAANMEPGASKEFTFTVENTGNEPDTFDLSGVPTQWKFDFNEDEIELAIGEKKTLVVNITVPEDALVDHPAVQVRATSQTSPSAVGSGTLDVRVKQSYSTEWKASVQPTQVNGNVTSYSVDLTNTGNGRDDISLFVVNNQELLNRGWSATITVDGAEANLTTLTANETKTVSVKLEAIRADPHLNTPILLAAKSEGSGNMTFYEIEPVYPTLKAYGGEFYVDGENVTLDIPVDNMGQIFLYFMIVMAGLYMAIYLYGKGGLR